MNNLIILKICFFIVCTFLAYYFWDFIKFRKYLALYINSVKLLIINIKRGNYKNNIDYFQKKLDDISINGFKLLLVILKLSCPYFIYFIFLYKTNNGFTSLITLPLMPYLILITKKS